MIGTTWQYPISRPSNPFGNTAVFAGWDSATRTQLLPVFLRIQHASRGEVMLPGCFSHLSYCSEYDRLLSSLPKRCPKWPAYPKNGIYLPNIRMTITGNRIFTIEQRRRSLSTRTRLSMQFHPAKKEREMPEKFEWKTELEDETIIRTHAWSPPGCHPVGCGLQLHVKDGKIAGLA